MDEETTLNRVSVLDHGYVELVEAWGSDEGIIEAARMSTAKGFLGWGPRVVYRCTKCGKDNISEEETYLAEGGGGRGHYKPVGDDEPCWGEVETKEVAGDEKLLRYLYENAHMSPFEMAGAIFEVKAPIMVFREWHRHRTQSYNEMSARYTPLPDENYVPSIGRLMLNSKTNKQAGTVKGAAELTEDTAAVFQRHLERGYAEAQARYEHALESGVPKELARLIVPVGRYSRMRASANLRNWMQFLTLRDDSHAQWEIRQYALVVREVLAVRFPRTMALYVEKRAP